MIADARSPGETVLTLIGRLQDEAAGTPLAATVDALVAALAADTTVADLRQEVAFALAEYGRHLHDCGARLTSNGFCTCGLDDALSSEADG